MPCNGETNLEGVRHPSKYQARLNSREELIDIAWGLAKLELDKIVELAWSNDKRGNDKVALYHYKAGNIFLYVLNLLIIVRNYMEKEGTLNNECLPSTANEKFKLDCVLEGLRCKSSKYGTDYVSYWNSLSKEFGIYKDSNCTDVTPDCCLGIGNMIIEGDDCTGFIIGGCDQECTNIEFVQGEFICEQFI